MTEQGSLRDIKEVKMLILYILKSSATPLSQQEITDIILANKQADFFSLPEAFSELISSDHIIEHNKLIHITALGIETISELYKLIPLYVREKAEIATLNMLTNISRDSQIKAELCECDGGFNVSLSISEEALLLFKLDLFVANRLQGEVIIKKFNKSPERYYQSIVNTLTCEE
ncbi:MAG: DUF4364 family protein [Clostridia bacterium]